MPFVSRMPGIATKAVVSTGRGRVIDVAAVPWKKQYLLLVCSLVHRKMEMSEVIKGGGQGVAVCAEDAGRGHRYRRFHQVWKGY